MLMDRRDDLPFVPKVGQPAGGQKERRNPWVYVEDAVIILAIFSLWPIVLGKHTLWSKVILVVALLALVIIFVVRLRRLRFVSQNLDREPD